MENNKPFSWSQSALIALLGVGGCLSLGLTLPIFPSNLQTQSTQIIDIKDVSLQALTQERIEAIKSSMLTSWQKEAVAKGISDIPNSFQGATIMEAKLPPGEKVIALTFDDGPSPQNTPQVLEILKKNNRLRCSSCIKNPKAVRFILQIIRF